MLDASVLEPAQGVVSIRARPGGRAMPAALLVKAFSLLFQSAPGREAGRCGVGVMAMDWKRLFQSAPGREAGRCALFRVCGTA